MKLPRCWQLSISATLLLLTLSSRALGAEPDVTIPSWVGQVMLSQPRPEYPVDARTKHITGRGVFDVTVRADAGAVKQVTIVQRVGLQAAADADTLSWELNNVFVTLSDQVRCGGRLKPV